LALEAIRLLFKYLPSAYQNGANDPKAREKVHYAASIAGMAFANAFLGICHSLAHTLGSSFHVPHGLANALLINHVIRYNATDAPFKQAIFPQYHYPSAKWHYANIADYLGLKGGNEDEKIESLVAAIDQLKCKLNIPMSIKAAMQDSFDDQRFFRQVDDMAVQAFDDQCTGANPRYPLITDLRDIYLSAYFGDNRNLPHSLSEIHAEAA
jgi:acetaldehyde dehydrogenase/alcohol dehydrogenase